MKVTRIAAQVSITAPVGSTQQTLELTAQAQLHDALRQQLRALWRAGSPALSEAERNGHGQQLALGEPATSQPPQHYCQKHQTPFKRHEKDGRVWYSHQVDGGWCREK